MLKHFITKFCEKFPINNFPHAKEFMWLRNLETGTYYFYLDFFHVAFTIRRTAEERDVYRGVFRTRSNMWDGVNGFSISDVWLGSGFSPLLPPVWRTFKLAGQLRQRAHFRTYLATELEPEISGFRAQVTRLYKLRAQTTKWK